MPFTKESIVIDTDKEGLNIAGLLDPLYHINIADFIDKISNQNSRVSEKVIRLWVEMQADSVMQGRDGDMDKIIGRLAFKISALYRINAAQSIKEEYFYIAWSRYAANHRNKQAAVNLLLYAIGHQLSDELVKHWADQAFEITLDEIKSAFHTEERRELFAEAHKLIVYLSPNYPRYSLTYLLQLMRSVNSRYEDELTNQLKSTEDNLISKIGGVRIIESIDMSGDRNVRSTCERYEGLTKAPTKLVLIGDLNHAQNILNSEFPWFQVLTKKLISSLQIRLLGKGDFYIAPLLILGDPGIGKTSYTLRFSKLMKVPFQTLSFAGKSDNRDLAGTARGWSTGHPSMPIALINEHKIANPIIMIDEVEKSGGSDHNGRVVDSLLNLFEPTSSKRSFDEYLCGNCDFSHISWICTANSVQQMPNTLLSRLDIVNVDKPTSEHYPAIINKSIASFFSENSIHPSHMPIIEEADWKWFEKYYSSPRVAKRAAYKWLSYRLLTPSKQLLH